MFLHPAPVSTPPVEEVPALEASALQNEVAIASSGQGFSLALGASTRTTASTLSIDWEKDEALSSAHTQAAGLSATKQAEALITYSGGKNWAVNYPTQNAQSAQAVIAELARSAVRSRQNCADSVCRGLEYINSQQPKVQREIQDLQAKITAFEAKQVDGSVLAYQQVLIDRQTEISQQKSALIMKTVATEQRMRVLKQQLAEIGAVGDEVNFSEQQLVRNADYKATWNKLHRAERTIAMEFSQPSANTAALYQAYDDYQIHQDALFVLAGGMIATELAQGNVNFPSFIWSVPGAIELVQQQAMVATERRMEMLRMESIAKIEAQLNAKRRQLSGEIGKYEQWQAQLVSARQVLSGYENNRAELIAQSTKAKATPAAVPAAAVPAAAAPLAQLSPSRLSQSGPRMVAPKQSPRDRLLKRAQQLKPYLPKGSTAEVVLYMALASAAVITIAARRRMSSRSAVALLQPASALGTYSQSLAYTRLSPPEPAVRASLKSAPTSFLRTTDELSFELEALLAQAEPARTPQPTRPLQRAKSVQSSRLVQPSKPVHIVQHGALGEPFAIQSAEESYAQRILAELVELTGQSTRMVNRHPEIASEAPVAEDSDITIELMTRELGTIVAAAAPEKDLASEIEARELAPVELSSEDLDSFLEQSINWVVDDLELGPIAAELDAAEAAVKAESARKSRLQTVGPRPITARKIAVGPIAAGAAAKNATASPVAAEQIGISIVTSSKTLVATSTADTYVEQRHLRSLAEATTV